MKVQNIKNKTGHSVPNQFIITDEKGMEFFQSYNSIICKKPANAYEHIELDKETWDYSKTTSKYRNQFLGETTAEIKAKIKSGEYVLTNLN